MSAAAAASDKVVNRLLHHAGLTQSYYALRHGQSLANVAHIISSDPRISTTQHGLSDVGKEQARKAGEAFAAEYRAASDVDEYCGVAVYSSDFTRARETAALFAEELTRAAIPLRAGAVVLTEILRERYFGALNGGSDARYREVWEEDAKDPDHRAFDVEPANAVLERTTKLVADLDGTLRAPAGGEDSGAASRWKVVLVAHGDVLQIMQTGLLKHADAARHRSLPHLETATIRALSLAR